MSGYILVRGDTAWCGYEDQWRENTEGREWVYTTQGAAIDVAQCFANSEGEAVDVVPMHEPTYQNTVTVHPEPNYVTAYIVTREYGGPEEGGWYFNRYRAASTLPIGRVDDAPSADECEAILRRCYGTGEGNISSVLGGYEVHIIREWEQGQHETNGRPTYE